MADEADELRIPLGDRFAVELEVVVEAEDGPDVPVDLTDPTVKLRWLCPGVFDLTLAGGGIVATAEPGVGVVEVDDTNGWPRGRNRWELKVETPDHGVQRIGTGQVVVGGSLIGDDLDGS